MLAVHPVHSELRLFALGQCPVAEGADHMTQNIHRRSFLETMIAAVPLAALKQAQPPSSTRAVRVPAGEDRFGEQRGLGITSMAFKVSTQDTNGGLFILEQRNREKGGPARHLHYEQDEWFYALEGEFIVEVGQERMTLKPGDSVLAPRRVPHVWAYVGGSAGRLLVAFTPAGKMEAFFNEIMKANAMPPQDPALWRAYGMELLGPPLAV
jgi:mannose-6-phosphate isomerase-like protein (cupin superfamily)